MLLFRKELLLDKSYSIGIIIGRIRVPPGLASPMEGRLCHFHFC